MRGVYFCSLVCLTFVFSGCTEMRIEGDAKVFESSAAGSVVRVIIGFGLIGLGVMAIAGGVLPDQKPKNRKGKRRRIKPNEKLSSGQRTGLALLGGAMGFAGLFLVGISFLSPGKLHVSVYPDRVAMASSYSQTGGKEIVVPFAGLSAVELRDERNVVGKLKKYLVFTKKNGKVIKQIAGGNESQAIDTIQRSLADFQARPPASVEKQVSVANSRPLKDKAARPGRLSTPSASATPESKDDEPGARAEEYLLKRYVINIPVPDGHAIVDAGANVSVGMKLGACYAGRWESVTVVAVNNDGTITCNWDKWTTYTYKMMREDLTIEN